MQHPQPPEARCDPDRVRVQAQGCGQPAGEHAMIKPPELECGQVDLATAPAAEVPIPDPVRCAGKTVRAARDRIHLGFGRKPPQRLGRAQDRLVGSREVAEIDERRFPGIEQADEELKRMGHGAVPRDGGRRKVGRRATRGADPRDRAKAAPGGCAAGPAPGARPEARRR